ncbi:hypothetical protein ACIF8T_26775 [Streptomyces sp. NPDC085946]|uniref:hypothetical protein n=1 Tax=Streptomyces sp. NPDC085946 TaxID=3365744 RepID=UPI0037D3B1C8
MTSAFSDTGTGLVLTDRLAHVRWIAGGTGAGKSTLTRSPADRYDVAVHQGDRAEHDWLERCTAQRHPRLAGMRGPPPGALWRDRTPDQVFRALPSLYGEMVGFVVDDLLALSGERVLLVDYFGIPPGHLAPLLRRPDQAVFLLPTPEFRETALASRYADPARARAAWGSEDGASAFAGRLARDALRDEEVRRQAPLHGLDTIVIDGTVPVSDLADRMAVRFGPGGGQRASLG